MDTYPKPGPIRRALCLVIGAALCLFGARILFVQLSGGPWIGYGIFGGCALMLGGGALLDTAFQNRRMLFALAFVAAILFFVLFIHL